MYGNFEYGTIPYGDAAYVIISITKSGIEVVFIAALKQSVFISRELSITFISAAKIHEFIAERKASTFSSLKQRDRD